MGFPKTLPVSALRQVSKFLLNQDRDIKRAALAAYDLTGYGLATAFPDVDYLADADPQASLATINTFSPELINICNTIDSKSDAELEQMGPIFELLLQTLGPIVIKAILSWFTKKTP